MSRFIIVILLITIFFLSGVMYGDIKSAESLELGVKIEEEITELTDRQDIEEELTLDEKPVFIQKIASTFEKVTVYAFDVIISFLYSIANSFFR